MGAIHLATNPATTPNSKHTDIRHLFIRERVANSEFKPGSVRSALKFCDGYLLIFLFLVGPSND